MTTPITFFKKESLSKKKDDITKSYKIILFINQNTDQNTDLYTCSWSSSICSRPIDINSTTDQKMYILSGDESGPCCVRLRISSVLECLQWIYNKDEVIEVNMWVNDIFVINMIRDWIPHWNKEERLKGNDVEHVKDGDLPVANYDLVKQLFFYMTSMDLKINFMSEDTYDMDILRKKTD